MTPASNYGTESDRAPSQLPSVDEEAISRLRLAVGVAVLTEIILPAVEVVWFLRPDWLAIDIQGIWLGFTLALFAATWHPRFDRMWRPSVLLLAIAMIVSSGILSIKGATLAPFMFLLVLLPPAGTILPWEPSWQVGMSSICVVLGLLFSTQFDWQNHLVISGLSALVASILGSHFVSAALAKQRIRINTYLQDLARSEEKFRKIFETSGSLIAIHSIPDGRVVDVNPAWERAFGYNRMQAVGRLPAELALTLDGCDLAHWVSSLKIGDAGAEQVPVVFRGRGENSAQCVYSWTTLGLNGSSCVLVVGQDVTARVRAEEELRRNREVLVNQERLKAVGELASGIAHDLNNSLNALRLRVELLCADSTLLPRHSASLQLISRIVRDAASTIGRLQDFARVRHDRPIESVDLNAIVSQSVEIAKSTLEEKNSLSDRSIHVETDILKLPLVLGDPGELRQIFLNLLLNAQDAMPLGGTIRIAGGREDGAIVIRVEDEGQGIPPEHLHCIFDPFFSTKGERGTGLGLSIAYGAMARIGGSIYAANRPNGGAVFTLSFPLAHTQPNPTAHDGSAKIQPRRVLVVDDDPNNLQALSDLLESKGHMVRKASSGPEALEVLLTGDSPVDVVFCDLGMREVNGWQIAQRVKSLKVPPAFYLVTGWGAEIPADDPRRHLVDAVIAKPVDLKILDLFLAAKNERKIASCRPTEEENNGQAQNRRLNDR
jgi:PAS domain S-box-containing protein